MLQVISWIFLGLTIIASLLFYLVIRCYNTMPNYLSPIEVRDRKIIIINKGIWLAIITLFFCLSFVLIRSFI